MARLPQAWFSAFAGMFNECLDKGKIPDICALIRMVGIPKMDGTNSKRGLGIAAYAWRLGMSDVIGQHMGWINSWLDAGIASGPGRSIEDLVDQVVHDAQEAEEEGDEFAGVKIDLAKYFDRCSPMKTIAFLEHLGIDRRVTGIIKDFYRQLTISLSSKGRYAQKKSSQGEGYCKDARRLCCSLRLNSMCGSSM